MEDVGIEAGAPLAAHQSALLYARRDSGMPADPEQAFSAGAARILELKAAHRRLCDATDAHREAVAEAKTQLDTSSLQLQVGCCYSWRRGSGRLGCRERAGLTLTLPLVPRCIRLSCPFCGRAPCKSAGGGVHRHSRPSSLTYLHPAAPPTALRLTTCCTRGRPSASSAAKCC